MAKIYYNAEELLKANADINIIDGGRNIGKSTEICRRAIMDAIETNGERGGIDYIRRKDSQIKNLEVETYIKSHMLEQWTNGEWECIKIVKGFGYLARIEEVNSNGKPVYTYSSFPVIKAFALFKADDYKSQNYDFDYAIYEEYQSKKGYLTDEPELLLSLFSTLKRENPHFKMFLIANTVCRINPYVNFFGMTNFNNQKKGTIDLYKLYLSTFDENGNENYLLIAREYTDLTEDGLKDDTVLAKLAEHKRRKRLSTMITRGDWEETHMYMTIKYREVAELRPYYTMFIQSQNACFKIEFYYDKENKMYFPYIVPHKLNLDEKKKQRIICNDAFFKSPYFTRTLTPLVQKERELINMLQHHARFCDNLTGNEFYAMLKNF